MKTRKEAKRMTLMDAIAARKARIEEIKRTVQDRRDTRDEYAAILSQQSTGKFLNCFSDWSHCCLLLIALYRFKYLSIVKLLLFI